MTTSRKILFGKLAGTLFLSLESATAFCKLRGNPYVELAHWFHQMLQLPDGDLHRIVRHAGINRETLDNDIVRALNELRSGASSISDFSHHIDQSIERAWVLATLDFSDQRVRGAWLLAALVKTPELRRVLLSISPEFKKIPVESLADDLPVWIDGSPENSEMTHDGAGFVPAVPGEASGAMSSAPNGSPLEQYCVDLTDRATVGEIDPVIGRELEIRTMIDVLVRRRQNNPLLTGEAGVGKTAVVEGLALAIARGDVPPKLMGARLLSLDVGALLAGASMKGEFEARLKGVLAMAEKAATPVLLFVDEIHTLIGAGGQAGTGDAANLLKPALARGTVRIIGATTWTEYKRHIEKDPALTRRFQALQVLEPEERSAIDMVRGLVETFSRHHGVVVLDEAVRAAVTLSHRYIPSRQLPDKAISLLDTACARVALSQHVQPRELRDVQQRLQAAQVEHELLGKEHRIGHAVEDALQRARSDMASLEAEAEAFEARWREQAQVAQMLLSARARLNGDAGDTDAGDEDGEAPELPTWDELRNLEETLSATQGDTPLVFPEVNEAIVATIVSDWTGIPVGRMLTDQLAIMQALPDILAQRVIGQDDALAQISGRVQTARAGLTDPKKPLGVFLLAGPSGVGKTEAALALAEALYGGEQNLITINMSEYQEAHTVSGLKGAPPGYVGYGEGGVLTEAVRRRPYSVILLDEVEKAHSDVHEMFFQVFDKGYMEDGDGRYIDFRNTTILLTSNVGSRLSMTLHADEDQKPVFESLCDALRPELLRAFPAAFMGRVTVVPFRPLASDSLANIVRLHLDRVVRRMAETHSITLRYQSAIVDYIIGRCLVQETGARALIGFIDQHIVPRLTTLCLDAHASRQQIARIDIDMADPDAAPASAMVFQARESVAAPD
ncbi:MAG: type VI secretion system ATPase TssH [Cupriavidus sp.]|nr:type VI secretion system ATPase TssH [Cupriavidus sp.]